MAVPKDVRMIGSQIPLSYPAASRMAFGAAVVGSGLTAGSETIKAATAETSILGFADKRKFVRSGGYDGFYEQYEEVALVDDFARALVTPNGADVNIDMGDFLEVAALGDGSTSPHGILDEAGSAAGGTFTVATVAKALESVTMARSPTRSRQAMSQSGGITLSSQAEVTIGNLKNPAFMWSMFHPRNLRK